VERGGIFSKTLFKKSLSLSQPMLKVPVYKGSRAFPAGAKGAQTFHIAFTKLGVKRL